MASWLQALSSFEGPLLSGALALGGVLLLTPLVIRFAHKMNWVARPSADRWHSEPTALMGGIAIFAAAALAVLVGEREAALLPVYGGAALLFVAGLVDDLRGLRPVAKLGAQVAATLLLLYAGYAFGRGGPFWAAIPLTFLWVIGITNAVNLLDNMDGLAAGIAAIAAVALAVFAGFTGQDVVGVGAMLAVAGAAGGFLAYNFKPARIFMGDCGSLFLGYTIAAFALIIQGQVAGRTGLTIYLVSLAVLAVPIFDTTLVTFSRTLLGRPVSQGGRDHSSHRLVFLGLSERNAVLTLYGISAVFGALALTFHFAAVKLFLALAVFLLIGLGVLGLHLMRADVYRTEATQGRKYYEAERLPDGRRTLMQRAAAALRGLMGPHWKAVLAFVADLLLVAASFVVAHYLRFENGLTPAREAALVNMLPAVVGIKLLVFAGAGLYRGMWRHAGTPELVLLGNASLGASLLTYIVLAIPYGTGFQSEAVFIIDWFVVTLAITGVRFGFRGLRQYFASKRMTGQRVLLYGAGDAGLLTLRELRQNASLGLSPVGFIDDDPQKQGRRMQGLDVLGTFDDLPRLCTEHEVEAVLITNFRMTKARKREVVRACEENGVQCRVFNLSLRPLQTEELTPATVSP